ncbi:hypothetical protein [Clostridium sp. ZBS12]|uniref:hypothetical protein n=1 Tax=Clostridium sp. ZBS12 TaxID=2949972 RepID=UPI00207AAB59|nr:hypothetical protein [Clostridium sp. ZBS12]
MNNICSFLILIGLVLILLINIISIIKIKKLYLNKSNNRIIFINCILNVFSSALIFIPIKLTFLLKEFMDIDVFDFLKTACISSLIIILVILSINFYYSLIMFLKKQ